jgi:hypothetical protein
MEATPLVPKKGGFLANKSVIVSVSLLFVGAIIVVAILNNSPDKIPGKFIYFVLEIFIDFHK